MDQRTLSKWLKFIIVCMGIFGLVIYFAVIPGLGRDIAQDNPEFSHCFWPWLSFIWLTGIPCYLVLLYGWKLSSNIGKDKSFSNENAGYLKSISILAAADSAFFFLGNILFLFLNMSHPGITLLSFVVVFVGVCVTVASGGLSHLVKKAAVLQEESDLTI